MKHTIRTLAVAALVAASALALPTAAQAVIYPPSNACSVDPATVAPNETVTFSCDDGTFSSNEPVLITVEGATSVDVGFIKFAVQTSNGETTSNGSGAISVPITFPSNAAGNYNISAVSETSAGGAASATVTSGVGAGNPGTGGSTGGSGTGGGSLPATGVDSGSLLGLWVGGGALVLAGGAVALAASVRRNRKEHAGV